MIHKQTHNARNLGVLILLTAGIATASWQTTRMSQDKTDAFLAHKVGVHNPGPASIDEAFVGALLNSHTPGGALFVERCGEKKSQVVIPTDATLSDAMNLITGSNVEYVWTSNKRTVNLIPKFFALSPLDMVIAKFKIKDALVADAYNQLYDMPEVRDGLAARNLQPPPFEFVVGGKSSSQKRITLNLKNVTLRDALNAIVEAEGQKIWLFKVRVCEGRNEYVASLAN